MAAEDAPGEAGPDSGGKGVAEDPEGCQGRQGATTHRERDVGAWVVAQRCSRPGGLICLQAGRLPGSRPGTPRCLRGSLGRAACPQLTMALQWTKRPLTIVRLHATVSSDLGQLRAGGHRRQAAVVSPRCVFARRKVQSNPQPQRGCTRLARQEGALPLLHFNSTQREQCVAVAPISRGYTRHLAPGVLTGATQRCTLSPAHDGRRVERSRGTLAKVSRLTIFAHRRSLPASHSAASVGF